MKQIRVGIFHKVFTKNPGLSHVGLGVSAANNIKILNGAGVEAEVKILNSDLDFLPILRQAQKQERPFTHVIISALWVRTGVINELCQIFKDTIFAINCHSNVGFLQAEPNAIKLIREQLHLQEKHKNFHIAGNSEKLVSFIRKGYGKSCTYLPNMYSLNNVSKPGKRLEWDKDTASFGMFGAPRVQKNFISGAAVAVQMHRVLGLKKTDLWINSGRNDTSDTARLIVGIEEITKDVPGFELHKFDWSDWFEFNKIVAKQDLLFQPSYSETFNIVTCDGIANGVPSLVSTAIDWAPDAWKANSDDIEEMTRVAISVLFDRKANIEGYNSLQKHNKKSLSAWFKFLGIEEKKSWFDF